MVSATWLFRYNIPRSLWQNSVRFTENNSEDSTECFCILITYIQLLLPIVLPTSLISKSYLDLHFFFTPFTETKVVSNICNTIRLFCLLAMYYVPSWIPELLNYFYEYVSIKLTLCAG